MNSAPKCKNALLIMSGKGGVGKSTLTYLISQWLSDLTILVIDVDLTGPSTPFLYHGIDKSSQIIEQDQNGNWIANKISDNLYLISLGLLLKGSDDAVIWRGPRKTSMIEEIISRTTTPKIPDLVLIDTPPGTSDEHIATIQTLKKNMINISALLVSTQAVLSTSDVRRQATFCSKLELPILGLVENMSNYQCEKCHNCIDVFGTADAGKHLAEQLNIPYLGSIPFSADIQEIGISSKLQAMQITNYSATNLINSIKTFINQN
ncbi:hypothetical protein GJ496_001405 [Pomphorhynchus laevis]|nr:hypothetical protein GJ496_001405 [Pomphorhynchus laevis]